MAIVNIIVVYMLFLSIALSIAPANASTISIRAAVRQGVAHFQKECAAQQALMPELYIAVSEKDTHRSIAAYTAARPPYEQIETLANVFGQQDADIDARPYAFRLGEDDPDFRGFHLLERALYRDQDCTSLISVVSTLNDSVNDLCKILDKGDKKLFTPYATFGGSVALAFEVPAKKVASEEETWSDLSLMIFRNNYRGIWSQVAPFLRTGVVSSSAKKTLRKEYANVRRVLNHIDPKHDFFTRKGDARPYSTVSFNQRARIIRTGYRFAKALEVVRDEVFAALPAHSDGDEEEEEEEDDNVDNARYESQVQEGLKTYLKLCKVQMKSVSVLKKVLAKGNMKKAMRAYTAARPPYEQIETLAGDFPTLDGYIDQRPYALERGEEDEGWRGFHLVERAIFRDGNLKAALAATKILQRDVSDLCDVLQDGVKGGGSFSAARQFDGMITLAYEVPAKKISSEEETWSDLSVLIFRENIKGIWAVFEPFKSVLPAKVAMDVEKSYRELRSLIEFSVDAGNDFDKGISFTKYSDVPVWERKMLSDKFYDLGRSLRKARAALKRI